MRFRRYLRIARAVPHRPIWRGAVIFINPSANVNLIAIAVRHKCCDSAQRTHIITNATHL